MARKKTDETAGYLRTQARRFLVQKMHEIGQHPNKSNPPVKELYAFARENEHLLPSLVKGRVWFQTPKQFLLSLGGSLDEYIPTYSERGLSKAQLTIKKEKSEARKWLKDFDKNQPERDRKKRDQFYKSTEWRTLRYEVLKKHDRRCMVCGASANDGHTVLHVDHIKPRSRHPELELDMDNLQVL
ncbi:MAG TPA: HNH endonuclease, partial [Chromatiaceae bacterium]|nr:HNH endonuclease [Chromatiaceae bacterium]